MEKVSDRIIKMRRVWRLSEQQMAGKLGITFREYKELESGDKAVSMDIAIKLCGVLQITLDYLMTGTISPKDEASINRPLTREEILDDHRKELRTKFSQKVLDKWEDLLFDTIYLGDKTLCPDRCRGIAIGKVLELDDFDLLSEMIRNEMIVVRDWNTKTKCSSVKDVFIKDTTFNGEITVNTNKHVETADLYRPISVKQMIVYLLRGRFHDPKFVEFLSKFSPVEMLNSYYLTREHINDKKEILSCIYNGGYVLKVVDFQYHTDYSRDEYGETVRTNVYGEDVLATELLKERCQQ